MAAQGVKVLITKPDDLSLISRAHIEGENGPFQIVLWILRTWEALFWNFIENNAAAN